MAWRGVAQRAVQRNARRSAAPRCSMVNEKSVSRDKRVRRSDNAYIIVGAFSCAPRRRKKSRASVLSAPLHKDGGI